MQWYITKKIKGETTMTQEEKAKAYDEAYEKVAIRFGSNVADEMFPELKESEDERIRKELICFLETEIPHCNARDKYIAWLEKQGKTFTKKDVDDAYLKGVCDAKQELEKQGEQKPYGQREECLDCQMNYVGECKGSCAMKRDEQKPAFEMITPEESLGIDSDTPKDYSSIDPYFIKSADKVKPKFNVGDWITNGKLTCKVLSVTGKSYELHLYNDDYCHFETDIQSVDKDYHLWTVKDAKKGDVLHSTGWHNDCIFIFDGLDNWKFDEPNGGKAVATGYCCLFVSAGKIEFGIQGPDCIEVDTVKPAIKIQRDLLFSKMKEAGWSWNATTKELSQSKEAISEQILGNSAKTCKDEQKPAWSEEDESKIKGIINTLEGLCDSATSDTTKDLYIAKIDWLKSIKCRVQPKQEWSEEYEKRIKNIEESLLAYKIIVMDNDMELANYIEKEINWLKSLKGRYTWKPSDEQMTQLFLVANQNIGNILGNKLMSLYNDLTKLK